MNWTDITVLLIIVIFIFIGVSNGFLYSIFRLLSYVIAILAAIKLYPILSGVLEHTALYSSIKASVIKSIEHKAGLSSSGAYSPTTAVSSLKLPGFLKDSILKDLAGQGLVAKNRILDAVGDEVAVMAIKILSVILIYLIIRFGLILARVLIKVIARLPVFKQLDKTGGFILGAIEGVLVVYVLCAALILFSAFPKFGSTIDSIQNSRIAYNFYQHNFIVGWISPDESNTAPNSNTAPKTNAGPKSNNDKSSKNL